MREVIAFAAARGSLLHPEVVRWLQTQAQPLEALQRALPANGAPMLLTLDQIPSARRVEGARDSDRATAARPQSAFTAAVVAATAHAPSFPQVVPPALGGSPSRLSLPPLPTQPFGAPPRTVAPGGMQLLPPTPVPPPAPAPPLPAMNLGMPEVAQIAHGIPNAPRLADVLQAPPIEILKDITGNSTCTGDLTDFTKYFNDRLRVTRRMLKQRREMAGVIPIERIPRGQTQVVKLIGIVNEVRTTKNGYRIIELEDETGTVPLLVLKNDQRQVELGEDPERIMQDEVIGVQAKAVAGKDILYLENFFHPDVEGGREPHRASEPALACFTSDVHFGAKNFLTPMWERFVAWLNGRWGTPEQKAIAQQVRFLVVAGDVVDGVGVYPGQEHELAIPDIEGQYDFCAKQFARLPDRVRVVMLPGNHDAVRPAEPQPAMADRLRKGYKSNVTFVGNPCQVSLMGVEVLAYHGVSLIDFVTTLRGLDVHKPIAIMQELLKRRHIAPAYGGHTPLAPEARDYLVIDRVPDVFVTGHLHTCDVGDYKGVTLINAGTWQDQTSYQKTLGIEPEPGRVAIVDLQNGRRSVMRFDEEVAAA